MVELFANSGDPNQMPCSAVSDLGLCCFSVTLLGVSRLQWVNKRSAKNIDPDMRQLIRICAVVHYTR